MLKVWNRLPEGFGLSGFPSSLFILDPRKKCNKRKIQTKKVMTATYSWFIISLIYLQEVRVSLVRFKKKDFPFLENCAMNDGLEICNKRKLYFLRGFLILGSKKVATKIA